jgi:hypothetical protein
MDVVKNKLEDSEKIIRLFSDYFDILRPLIEERYYEETKVIKEIVANYPKQQKIVNAKLSEMESIINEHNNTKKVIEAIFDFYHTSQDFFLTMENTTRFLDQSHFHTENIDDNTMSQTYKLEAADFFYKLLTAYNNFIKKHKENDAVIIEYLTETLISFVKKEYNLPEALTEYRPSEYRPSTLSTPSAPNTTSSSSPIIAGSDIEDSILAIVHFIQAQF